MPFTNCELKVRESLELGDIAKGQLLVRDFLFQHPGDVAAQRLLEELQAAFRALPEAEQWARCQASAMGPKELVVEISGRCNLKCPMCIGVSGADVSNLIHTPFNVPAAEISRFIDGCGESLEKVYLSGISEPMLAASFRDVCSYIHAAGKSCGFLTNGTLLNDDNCNFLASLDKFSVGISFDGATPETFERIRYGASFQRVVDNIRNLTKAFGHKNRSSCFVGFNFCSMSSNIDELTAVVELAASLGVDNVHAHHLVPQSVDMVEESLFFHQQRSDDAMLEAETRAKALGLSFSCPTPFGDAGQGNFSAAWKRCDHPWRVLQIQRFKVATCCTYVLAENERAGELENYSQIYPNVGSTALWNIDELRQLRRSLLSGTPSRHCRECINYPYDRVITPKKLLACDNRRESPVAKRFMALAHAKGLI